MPHVESHGVQISYDDQGQGEPVLLFMPGWCGSRRVFDELARRCAQWRRALALTGAGMDGPRGRLMISDSATLWTMRSP